MNETKEQLESIYGGEDLSHDEKLNKVKNTLNTDFYRPNKTVKPESIPEVYNPAIEIINTYFEWKENTGWIAEDDMNFAFNQFPEYIPSNEIITELSSIGEILEIGAGGGYWGHVINMNGGECITTDLYPPKLDIPVDNYPVTQELDGFEISTTIWSDIKKRKHTCISEFSGDYVMICHPEGLKWTEEILDLIKPTQKLILISEWYPGPDSTPFFFKELNEEWNLIKKYPVLNWDYSAACCYIFDY